MHPAGLAGQPLERTADRHGGDDLAAGGADRRRHRGHSLLALADRLRPAATANAGQRGGGEGGVLQAAVDPLGVLPGEQHLCGGAGAHGQLRPDRDRVAQPRRTLGRGDADAVVALAAPQLRRLAGDVAQAREHRSGRGQQAVLAGGDRELGQARAQHEASLQVAGDEPVVLERDGEPVRRRAREARGGDQSGEGRRSGLERSQHEGGLVEHPDAAGGVHMAILPSQIMGRKL